MGIFATIADSSGSRAETKFDTRATKKDQAKWLLRMPA